MHYHGNNPLGRALAADVDGDVRDRVLRILQDHDASVQRQMAAASTPATYQRLLAATQCVAACAQVVQEFHAICGPADPEQAGRIVRDSRA